MYAHTHLPKFLIDATAVTPNTAVFNNPNFPTIVPKNSETEESESINVPKSPLSAIS